MKIWFACSERPLLPEAQEAIRKVVEEMGAKEVLVTLGHGVPPDGGHYVDAFLGMRDVSHVTFAISEDGRTCRFAAMHGRG